MPAAEDRAYTGERLEEQLAEQTGYVHTHPRWFRFDAERHVVHLTELYDWYGTDFQQYALTVLDYAARFVPELKKGAGRGPPAANPVDQVRLAAEHRQEQARPRG